MRLCMMRGAVLARSRGSGRPRDGHVLVNASLSTSIDYCLLGGEPLPVLFRGEARGRSRQPLLELGVPNGRKGRM